MTKIKVLQIIDSLNTGGAEVLAVNIANSLVDIGYESHICTTRKEGDLKKQIKNNVGYLFLERNKTIDLKAIKVLLKYIKKHKINYIHAHASSSFIGFLVKLFSPSVKLIWHDHYGNSEFLKERKTIALKLFSYFFSAIISVNKILEFWAKDKLACSKVFFVNNFVEFRNLSKQTHLKGSEGKRIVILAGFRPQKDHMTLLKAFRRILQEFPDWSLHFVGKVYDDDYSKGIIEFIEKNKLNNSVFFYGVKSDVKFILEQSSIGVLSSKSEGLPLALLEYGLAKLPVVITNVGECRTVLNSGENGVLVEPENSESLYFGLKSMINSDTQKEEFSRKLNETVLRDYSKESVIYKYSNIYKNC
jgi:glycosyltransferase involved in cell wall biosynthesis